MKINPWLVVFAVLGLMILTALEEISRTLRRGNLTVMNWPDYMFPLKPLEGKYTVEEPDICGRDCDGSDTMPIIRETTTTVDIDPVTKRFRKKPQTT